MGGLTEQYLVKTTEIIRLLKLANRLRSSNNTPLVPLNCSSLVDERRRRYETVVRIHCLTLSIRRVGRGRRGESSLPPSSHSHPPLFVYALGTRNQKRRGYIEEAVGGAAISSFVSLISQLHSRLLDSGEHNTPLSVTPIKKS